MMYTIQDIINKYGTGVIKSSDLTKTGGLKNKARVINRLKTMYVNVDTYGRGKDLIFELDNLKSKYVIDKRTQNITTIQSMIKNNLFFMIQNNNLTDEILSAQEWLTKLGVKYICLSARDMNNRILDYYQTQNKSYIHDWKPNPNNYEPPSLKTLLCDKDVNGTIFKIVNNWYSNQFIALKKKVFKSGVYFNPTMFGLVNGEYKQLTEADIKRINKFNAEYISLHGITFPRLIWNSSEYKSLLKDIGVSSICIKYSCEISDNFNDEGLVTKKIATEAILYESLEEIKLSFIRKEIGSYKGFYNNKTIVPYKYKKERLEGINNVEIFGLLDFNSFDSGILKSLKHDYDNRFKVEREEVIYKLKFSRMLYILFKEITKIVCSYKFDDHEYNNAVKKWNQEYEDEKTNGFNKDDIENKLEKMFS